MQYALHWMKRSHIRPINLRTDRYSLHPIPTIGLIAEYKGESLYYSGDTRFDPELGKELLENGNIKEGRKFDLNDSIFRQEFSCILHEAGVPPIHTPIDALAMLPPRVKQNLYIVHSNFGNVEEHGLQNAKEWSTIEIPIRMEREEEPERELRETVNAILSIPLFYALDEAEEDVHKAMAKVAKREVVKEGTVVFEKDSKYDKLIIIEAGIVKEGTGIWTKQYTVGDHIGELSLCSTDEHKTTLSTFTALTDVQLMVFEATDLLPIIKDMDEVMEAIVELALCRKKPSWDVLARNSVFERTSDMQRLDLQDMMTEKVIPEKAVIFTSGKAQPFSFFILSGTVDLDFDPKDETTFRGNNEAVKIKAELGVGALVCDINNLLGRRPSYSDVVALEETRILAIENDDMHEFLKANPGIIFSLMDAQYVS